MAALRASPRLTSASTLASLEQTTASTILEIGAATGRDTALLRQGFPDAAITAIDFSEAMIERAQEKGLSSVDFRCEDVRDFLRDRDSTTSYDLVFSNSSLQWIPSLSDFFTILAGALSKGGFFVGSVFGPETFSELQSALKTVFGNEASIAANEFLGQGALTTALESSFSELSIDEQLFHLHFDSLQELLYSLKQGGVTVGGSKAQQSLIKAIRPQTLANGISNGVVLFEV